MVESRCPHCNEIVYELSFDVTGTCSSFLYKDNVLEGETCIEAYDLDSLLSNVEFDNFGCPHCGEIILFSEEEAINFLKYGTKEGKWKDLKK